MTNILQIITMALSLFNHGQYTKTYPMTCLPPEWDSEPSIQENVFVGSVSRGCAFTPAGDGSFDKLAAHLNDQTKHGKVHSVAPGNYFGLTGNKYDVTFTLASDLASADARGIYYIISDSKSVLVVDFESTEISGEGNAKYLKKADMGYRIDVDTIDAYSHTIVFSTQTEIERPWFVPAKVFLAKAKEKMEAEFIVETEQIVQDVAGEL